MLGSIIAAGSILGVVILCIAHIKWTMERDRMDEWEQLMMLKKKIEEERKRGDK